MNIQQLQIAVFEKTGIRIDDSDPVLAIVALNETVVEELLSSVDRALKESSFDLDKKITRLIDIQQNIISASQEFVEMANRVHLTSALKAATDVRYEIMNATRNVINQEVEKITAIPPKTTSAQRLIEISLGATIGGMVGATIICLIFFLLK